MPQEANSLKPILDSKKLIVYNLCKKSGITSSEF